MIAKLALLATAGLLLSSSCSLLGTSNDQSILSDNNKLGWESDPKRRRRAPYKKRTLIDKKQSLQTLVKGFSTAEECYRRAKDNSTTNLEASWALVRACIQYRGYSKLDEILDEPWLKIHKLDWQKSAQIVAQISAMRGGHVELDVGICTRLGFEIRNLEELLRDAEGEKNTLTLFRGKLTKFSKKAGSFRLIIRNDETDISASINESAFRPQLGQEYVFLGIFNGLRQVTSLERMTDEIAEIKLKAVFPIALAHSQ